MSGAEDFEPDVNLMCDAAFGDYRCTRTHGHDGDHVAHGGLPVRGLCSWPALDDAVEQLRTRFRFAKEIGAAHADPDWPLGGRF